MSYWQQWAAPLKELLDLPTSPVAVTYAHAGAAGASEGKLAPCQAILRAAQGEMVQITAGNCGCHGGTVNLGFGEMTAASMERLTGYLVEREKVYCSAAAIFRGQQVVKLPVGLASHVIFSPLEQAERQPDLVLFVCNAQQAEQLVSLCSYWEGGSLAAELAGPACRTALAVPLATGQVGLSLLDHSARRLGGYTAEQMVVALPLHRAHLAVAALERGAGRMGTEDAATMQRRLRELDA